MGQSAERGGKQSTSNVCGSGGGGLRLVVLRAAFVEVCCLKPTDGLPVEVRGGCRRGGGSWEQGLTKRGCRGGAEIKVAAACEAGAVREAR